MCGMLPMLEGNSLFPFNPSLNDEIQRLFDVTLKKQLPTGTFCRTPFTVDPDLQVYCRGRFHIAFTKRDRDDLRFCGLTSSEDSSPSYPSLENCNSLNAFRFAKCFLISDFVFSRFLTRKLDLVKLFIGSI